MLHALIPVTYLLLNETFNEKWFLGEEHQDLNFLFFLNFRM
jgi:hypothetical protein